MTEDTDDLLTISALSKLYGVDRRTVQRRLAKVKPVRVRRVGSREFKFYRLSAVRDIVTAPSASKELQAAYEALHAVQGGR